MSKVTILSLSFISLCFLTLLRPQFFMLTDRNKYFLPVKFSSQNVFRVDQPCINRESKSLDLKIKLYSCHNINMKFLVVVTPPSIYHGCYTRKTFWEEHFTGKKDFLSVNMKNCGRRKVRKHKKSKVCDKIVTLDISSKFDSLNKIKTTSSESKEKMERSRKGLVTALDFKTKVRS